MYEGTKQPIMFFHVLVLSPSPRASPPRATSESVPGPQIREPRFRAERVPNGGVFPADRFE